MTPFDYFDLFAVLFILLGAIWGLFKGFVSALSVLLATSAGILAAHRLTEGGLAFLGLEPTGLLIGIAHFVLFALTSMVVYQLMHQLEIFVQRRHLGAWNHVLGLIFGSVLSIVLCWIVAWGLTFFPQTRSSVTQSRSAKYLVRLAEFSKDSIPENREDWSDDPSGSLASIPETFIDRVEEDAAVPRPEASEENAKVHEVLDSIDEPLSKILIPESEEKNDSY